MAPNGTAQPPYRTPRLTLRALKRGVTIFVLAGCLAILSAGCSDDPNAGPTTSASADSQPQAGIYGIYEGPSSDYSSPGVSGPVVDNGFQVDGENRATPQQTAKAQDAKPSDTLASSKDTLSGNDGKDALTGESDPGSADDDPTKPKSNDNTDDSKSTTKKDSVDSMVDPLDSDEGGLDSSNGSDPLTGGADMGLNKGLDTQDRDDNYYSYKMKGLLTNANLVIYLNGSPVVVTQGGLDQDISPLVHHGMNRISFEYTPVDETSRARITIDRFSDPPLPACATFDSYYDKSANGDAKTIIVTQYFLGE